MGDVIFKLSKPSLSDDFNLLLKIVSPLLYASVKTNHFNKKNFKDVINYFR